MVPQCGQMTRLYLAANSSRFASRTSSSSSSSPGKPNSDRPGETSKCSLQSGHGQYHLRLSLRL